LRKAGHTVALPVNALCEYPEFARLIVDADEVHIWTLDKFLLGMVYLRLYGDSCGGVKIFCEESELEAVIEDRTVSAFVKLGAEVVTCGG